jgi:predicted HTH domain antitoxin
MAITIELPLDVEQLLNTEWPNLNRRALEAVVLEGYRDGVLSRGKVAEILGLTFSESELFLRRHEAFLDYDDEDLKRDQETLGSRSHDERRFG